jgi:hypothetical protein
MRLTIAQQTDIQTASGAVFLTALFYFAFLPVFARCTPRQPTGLATFGVESHWNRFEASCWFWIASRREGRIIRQLVVFGVRSISMRLRFLALRRPTISSRKRRGHAE